MVIWLIKTFLVQFFCVFLPLLLNLFCFCLVLVVSFLYCACLSMKYSLGLSNFLEISRLSHSIVFLYLFALFMFLSLLAILWNSVFTWVYLSLSLLPFVSLLSIRPPQTTTLPSCISFSLGWFWSLPPVQCYGPPSRILQALWLPDLIP